MKQPISEILELPRSFRTLLIEEVSRIIKEENGPATGNE